jgi:hypothetical protein
MNIRRLTDQPVVIAADTGNALILLDTRTGRVTAIIGAAQAQWRATHRSLATIPVREVPVSWGTSETPAGLEKIAAPQLRWRWRATIALAITLTMRNAGPRCRAFARMTTLARLAARTRRAATREDVLAALHAVRWMARRVPARVACLESSVAGTVAVALRGRRVHWVHGIAGDPVRMHAWLETDGLPVGEPPSTHRYTPVLRIPSPARTQGGPR